MATAALKTAADLQTVIDCAWEDRANVDTKTRGEIAHAVEEALNLLDSGQLRIAEKNGKDWVVNQWLKKAVLLSFRLNPNRVIPGGPRSAPWYDKVESKFSGWGEDEFKNAGFRAVPGAIVRKSSTPPRPTPPEMWQFFPTCAQEPIVTHVSTIVPSST